MRLAYISASALPSRSANSVHVMKMCQALSAEGHEVTLFAPSQPSLELCEVEDIHSYYGVNPSFRLIKKPFPRVPGRAFVYALSCLRALKSLEPDIVYGRYFPAIAAACLGGYPTAYESHEKLWQRGGIVRRLMGRVFSSPSFRQLVVISEALAGFYREAGLEPACGITVAHDAADPVARAAEDSSPSLPVGFALHCGYIGSLYRGRGVELLLDCAAELPDCCFHFVGGSPEDHQRLLDERGDLPANAVFHGHLSPPAAEKIRAEFDILLAPYQRSVAVWGGKGDTSSFMSPLKIFEYMAAGKAILCSDLPVLREVLDEGCSVFLPADDSQAWTSALAALRGDESKRQALGKSARELFEARYTWRQRARKILEACQEPSPEAEREQNLLQ